VLLALLFRLLLCLRVKRCCVVSSTRKCTSRCPAAADVRVDPAALRLVPTAVRVKRDSSAVASVASGGDAPPRKSARHAEPQQPNKLDDAFASFMHDIDNLNS
jgi:hypothetical protein